VALVDALEPYPEKRKGKKRRVPEGQLVLRAGRARLPEGLGTVNRFSEIDRETGVLGADESGHTGILKQVLRLNDGGKEGLTQNRQDKPMSDPI